jgi:hypothetical protein
VARYLHHEKIANPPLAPAMQQPERRPPPPPIDPKAAAAIAKGFDEALARQAVLAA